MADIGTLFGNLARINRSGSLPRLEVWDNVANVWVGLSGAGGAGSPLLRPGGLRHAVELVVLPGDPPDPVTLGGDFVYLRRMQPEFTLSPSGDLTLVEGA